MSGSGSTRWNGEPVRPDTDSLLKLDVRWLQRVGALAPNRVFCPSWTLGGRPAGDMATVMDAAGEILTLVYMVADRATGHSEDVREPVALERTPQRLGGHRVWFRCPGCGRRCAILFCLRRRFRCRQCHDLAYASTRERPLDRIRRRCRKLQTQLGLTSIVGVPSDMIPPKPKGMHQKTYARLVGELSREIMTGDALAGDELAATARRIEKLRWRRPC